MVNLYAANIGTIADPKMCPDIMEGLSEERKDKILHFKMEHSRKQSLIAGLLLKYVLDLRGLSMEKITYGQNGKPGIEGMYFNLSHSGDMVICAVSDRNIGCDIETVSTVKEGIADRFFTKQETQYLNFFEGPQKEQEFFRLWTIKESYMKLTGEGMSLPLSGFNVKIGENISIERNGEICPCHIKEYEIDGYRTAVCAMEQDFDLDVTYVSF